MGLKEDLLPNGKGLKFPKITAPFKHTPKRTDNGWDYTSYSYPVNLIFRVYSRYTSTSNDNVNVYLAIKVNETNYTKIYNSISVNEIGMFVEELYNTFDDIENAIKPMKNKKQLTDYIKQLGFQTDISLRKQSAKDEVVTSNTKNNIVISNLPKNFEEVKQKLLNRKSAMSAKFNIRVNWLGREDTRLVLTSNYGYETPELEAYVKFNIGQNSYSKVYIINDDYQIVLAINMFNIVEKFLSELARDTIDTSYSTTREEITNYLKSMGFDAHTKNVAKYNPGWSVSKNRNETLEAIIKRLK